MGAVPSFFLDDVAQAALEARVPNYVAGTGLTFGGSCACGIGISSDNAGLEESLPNWTLLDQHENARNAQISQCIGGDGISTKGTSSGSEGTAPDAIVRFGVNPANVDGQPDNNAPVIIGNRAVLIDLATGWEGLA